MAYDLDVAKRCLRRRVIVTLADKREIYCVITMAEWGGIMVESEFGTDLWQAADIVDIRLQKPAPVKVKPLAHPSASTVRQHLADRHGIWIENVNEWTDDQALASHDKMNHGRLSHRHEDLKRTPKNGEVPIDADQLTLYD